MQEPIKFSTVQKLTISSLDVGQRIDNFLQKLSNAVPKSHIYRIIRKGQVRVNGGRIKATYKLKLDDEVRVPPLYDATRAVATVPDTVMEMLERSVIYEDDQLIALNKPPGIAVQGGSGLQFGVIDAMRQSRSSSRLELVHRIDRGTSGCLLIGKNRLSAAKAQEAFRSRQVRKRYSAIVAGRWNASAKRVEFPLSANSESGGQRKVVVSPDGKAASSVFDTEELFESATSISVLIETGRTHQIRVHSAVSGFPVVGDSLYGDSTVNRDFRRLGLKRMFLHSAELELEDGSGISIVAPVDDKWLHSLESLRGNVSPGGDA